MYQKREQAARITDTTHPMITEEEQLHMVAQVIQQTVLLNTLVHGDANNLFIMKGNNNTMKTVMTTPNKEDHLQFTTGTRDHLQLKILEGVAVKEKMQKMFMGSSSSICPSSKVRMIQKNILHGP